MNKNAAYLSFFQKLLLDLLGKIKPGCTTEESIRLELKNTFPKWNVSTHVTGNGKEVTES